MFNLNVVSALLLASTYIERSFQHPTEQRDVEKQSFSKRETELTNGQIVDGIAVDARADAIAGPPKAGEWQFNPIVYLSAGEPGYNQSASGLARPTDLLHGKGRFSSANGTQKRTAGVHWYATTEMKVANAGTGGSISMFKPFVQSEDDYSILQLEVLRINAKSQRQTVEAGWINSLGDLNGDMRFFTYYTTNDYGQQGDKLGGWNSDVEGWVQVDKNIFPGVPFSRTYSIVGGQQYDFSLEYSLIDGKWWLLFNGKGIGYYPASLFGDPATSLAGQGDYATWIGVVYQSESSPTTTDMGSGHPGSDGYKKAAYFRNMKVRTLDGQTVDYVSTNDYMSDPSKYQMQTYWNSNSDWDSCVFLGGPGAGGQIGS